MAYWSVAADTRDKIHLLTLTGGAVMTIGKSAVLTEPFVGELIDPDHPDYDTARKIHNGCFDHHPALVAQCTGPEDVRAALAHARANDLVVAVRGGAHSTPGYSSCDGGVVIDTGPMKASRSTPGPAPGG
jgi:FAD/FMN-containing dehydrogenase